MHESIAADIEAISKIQAVQKILEVVCRTTGLGFSAVARVTDKQWVACSVRDEISFGLAPGGELELETTICNEIRQSGELVVIDHVLEDERFCHHPTPKKYGFQSYISVPIMLNGREFFGTLCAIDPRPAKVDRPEIIEMFKLFADLIGMHLETQARIDASEAALLNERQTAQLRDQFIAVLGHDLRNPLAAVNSAAELMQRLPQSNTGKEMLGMIKRSVSRMSELIVNVLDFARGQLGGGISLSRTLDPGVERVLGQVVLELQTAWPSRNIRNKIAIGRAIHCDSSRLAQMLSNLLANALTHGDPEGTVTVNALIHDMTLEIEVINTGETIAPHIIDSMFKPFARGTAQPGQQGLGLGLYIASEIAKAHDGTLSVTSKDGETRFVFKMPI